MRPSLHPIPVPSFLSFFPLFIIIVVVALTALYDDISRVPLPSVVLNRNSKWARRLVSFPRSLLYDCIRAIDDLISGYGLVGSEPCTPVVLARITLRSSAVRLSHQLARWKNQGFTPRYKMKGASGLVQKSSR